MINNNELDEVAELCLAAYKIVKQHGTDEIQYTMRLLLFQVGQEIARCRDEQRKKRDA